jgi:hypothetical protein
MATKKKIVSADTLKPKKSVGTTKKSAGSKLDLGKIKDFVSDNKDTIEKIADVAEGLFGANTSKKTSKTKGKKTKGKKTTSKSSSMLDMLGTLFKK